MGHGGKAGTRGGATRPTHPPACLAPAATDRPRAQQPKDGGASSHQRLVSLGDPARPCPIGRKDVTRPERGALGAGQRGTHTVGGCYSAPWRPGGARILPLAALDCNGNAQVPSTKTEPVSVIGTGDTRMGTTGSSYHNHRRHTDESATENCISFMSGQ